MPRPRKKPDYDPALSMQEQLEKVAVSFGSPYDDRHSDGGNHVSIRSVAQQHGITILKARKMLITAGLFSTTASREVQKLTGEGKSIPEIMEMTGLSRASVHSYLPYTKIVYKMPETSVDADRKKHQRERERICREFTEEIKVLTQAEADDKLWEVLGQLQGCVFFTAKELRFKYTVRGGELFVDRKKDSVTKATVFMAFHKALELHGEVSGPKKLGTFGASYLYPVFQRIGIIEKRDAYDAKRHT